VIRRRAERVFEMVRKEFRQIFRDPRMRRVIFVAPMIQLIVFGYAVSTDIRNTSTIVVDHDRTQRSRELIEAFTASGYFRIVEASAEPRDVVAALDHGRAIVGVVIPRGFTADVEGEAGADVQILIDGTNSNTALLARGYAERIVQQFGARIAGADASQTVALDERAWFNPDLASRNYNVPAVIGVIIMLVSLLLTALAVVREREIGTLEQLQVSPLTPGELIAGKTIPFGLIGLADLTFITIVALLWFNVPFRGALPLLFGASVLYLLPALGAGLLISTISNTQQEAFMATFLLFMPTILLSGFMFPVSSMPEVFQWVTLLNPLRHYLEIIRGVFLKGTGLVELWQQHLALLLMGPLVLWFAARRFRTAAG
jgi:ABC-2 type transport system permease protein